MSNKSKIKETAYYDRIRKLANINETSNNNTSINNSTLIDYERGNDGIAYGIVKENHNYFVKRSTKQDEPNVQDFSYIGGLENIHEHKYNSVGDAKKQRHLLVSSINEAFGNTNSNVTKKSITENIDDEIAQAETNLDQAEDVVDTPEPDNNDSESVDDVNLDINDIEVPEDNETNDNSEGDSENTEPNDGEENGEGDEDKKNKDDDSTSSEENGEGDEENKEIQKMVGKITNKIRNTVMTDSQVKSYLNSFIASFEEKLPELEIEDRKEIANKITKIVDGEEDLKNAPDEDLNETKSCDECGFAKFAESNGYDVDSLMECDSDEMANLFARYSMDVDDDLSDEDLQSMALLSSPEAEDTLVNEYEYDNLAESIKEYSQNLMEVEDADKKSKIEGMFWWMTDPKKPKDTELKPMSEEDYRDEKGDVPGEQDTGPHEYEKDENENSDVSNDINMDQPFDVMGVNSPSLNDTNDSSVDVEVNKEHGTVNVKLNETEKKVRNYIRNTLQEKIGLKKPILLESEKNPILQEIDSMIDEYLKEYDSLDELDFSFNRNKKIFNKIDPNNEESIDNAFQKIFSNALSSGARKKVASELTSEQKYELMKAGIKKDELKSPSFGKSGNQIFYKEFKPRGDFGSGGTGGKTGLGGV